MDVGAVDARPPREREASAVPWDFMHTKECVAQLQETVRHQLSQTDAQAIRLHHLETVLSQLTVSVPDLTQASALGSSVAAGSRVTPATAGESVVGGTVVTRDMVAPLGAMTAAEADSACSRLTSEADLPAGPPVIMDLHSTFSRETIERDLESYANHLRRLHRMEVEAVYGAVDSAPADTLQLSSKGTCILHAVLRRGVNCIAASWHGQSGRHFLKDVVVVIRRRHPNVESPGTLTVADSFPGRLQLHHGLLDLDIEHDRWRLDVEANYVSLYRVDRAIRSFTSVPPSSPPTTLQLLMGTLW